jgi:hypothetical protein
MKKYFKVIDNFINPRIFKRLLIGVESQSISWLWNDHSYIDKNQEGDNLWMFSQILFNNSPQTIHPFYQAFQVLEDFQADIIPFKQVLKSKLNLYPNQGKSILHKEHKDINTGEEIDNKIMTSVFNFHDCNGGTVVNINGKEEKIDSKANRLILFDNTYHYGYTQTDIPRRIVLNLNVLK